RLGPALQHDREALFERLTVALLILDRRAVGTAQRFVLARLIAAADAALDTATADHVEQRDLLSKPHRVMPDDDVGGLAKPDALRARRDGHLHHQRIGTHLGALGLEMMLGQPKRLEPELFRENALADL